MMLSTELAIDGVEPVPAIVEVDAFVPGWPVFRLLGYRDLTELWLYRDERGRWRVLFHVELPQEERSRHEPSWPSPGDLIAFAFPEHVS